MEAFSDTPTSARSNASASTFINPAIHGWAKIQRMDPHSDATTRAENLLSRLLNIYVSTNDHFFRPRLHTFNGVLDAFSKSASKEAPEKARSWVQRMITEKECVSPDRISFNCVLNAFASRGNARKAIALFQVMKEQQSRGLQPDTYSYNMLMKAWQRSGSPKAPAATAQLLEEYKQDYKRQGKNNLFLRPNVSIYSIAMSLASAEKAHSLLDEMFKWNQREMLPRAYHYAMVMNSYAREGQPEKAEEIFMQMLQLHRDGQNDVRPNLQNFCILIKAWCKQRSNAATDRAEAILKEMELLFLESGVPTGERMNTYGYNSGKSCTHSFLNGSRLC
jgi:pentatricopeptide repeat protein